MSTDGRPLDENAVLVKYKELTAECSNLVNKITELEQDRNEHKLVEETLKPLDPNRRAFRLVGGVLVERTVGEVLPSVASNRSNVSLSVCVHRIWLLMGAILFWRVCAFTDLVLCISFIRHFDILTVGV
uniref:Prefoldin subunit 2 n=1 Tax=Ditylum brightwellii TaxID=49249 RepID=A0A7S2EK20_9STRA|mmetsp:Transcript_33628/g.50150  ORF Transcript_33628/g.50150 Transcript_33628/m.50150 type:complete len:129 (+) Transcript_33628:177-563(+)